MSSGMLRRDIRRRFIIIIIITSLSAGTHAGRACVSGRTLLTLLKLDEQTQAVFKCCNSNQHFSEFYLQDGGENQLAYR